MISTFRTSDFQISGSAISSHKNIHALRIAALEVIGVNVSDDVKNYVMDEHLDWIKLEKHLDEDCVLPMNVFRQMIEKLQNQEQNS